MTKYLISRILRALFSVVLVIAVIMIMIYSFLDKQAIFANDPQFTKMKLNTKEAYMMQQWEKYGYLDYVPFSDYLTEEVRAGRLTQEDVNSAKLAITADQDNDTTKTLVAAFTEKYEAEGYTVRRLDGSYKIGTKKFKDGVHLPSSRTRTRVKLR